MSTQPIPMSARTPAEYIPFPQDAEAYRRIKQPAIEALERDLTAMIEALRLEENAANEGKPDSLRVTLPPSEAIILLEQEIANERDFMERNIDTIRASHPSPMCFTIAIPTAVEREMINSRLITLGLRQVTQEQMRATMVEELFHQDWGQGSPEGNEAEAENLANFLDGVWQRQEAHDVAVARWQEQEVERILDEAEGAPARPRADLPPKIVSVRENAKMTMLVDRMMQNSEALRRLAGEAADFNRQNGLLLVRAHVLGATNVRTALEVDRRTNALPVEQVLALREEMDDASWNDLVGYIDRLYKLDGYEEKNFDSPPVNPSGPTGSIEPIDGTESSGGSLTTSSTTPAPAGGSGPIIAPSSPSTYDHVQGAISEPNYSPTAGVL